MTDHTRPHMPTSTYRLHLTHEFTLHHAADMVDYLDELGVDWIYCSPIQTVPAGATHGYHIIDPDWVNPELGGEEGLQALREAASRRGRGMVLDIVPNHMAASVDNRWWADVLARGPASPVAHFFDIDFDAGPVVLPVLGEALDQAVASGALHLQDGQVVYHDLQLPLAQGTDTAAPIEQVLAAQHYTLMEWQEGERTLNWRRFFAINDLAGLRVEDPVVFRATHDTIAGWVDDGLLQGVRVDHIDGLIDPAGYLNQLRQRLGPNAWIVVEKIVEQGEELPQSWPVEGTTGYEVNAAIGAWLTNVEGHQQLRSDFVEATGLPLSTRAALPESKLAAMDELFTAEVGRVVELLLEGDDDRQEETVQTFRSGVRLLTAHLDGYRTYAPPEGPVSDVDVRTITRAAEAAGDRSARVVAARLLHHDGRAALQRLQQLTGPAAAKGFEDRLLFRQVALSGLCEVGADADLLDHLPSAAQIGQFFTTRAAHSPHAGSTTSTHDTKRSEDVRARLAVLAELPSRFASLLSQVTAILAEHGDRELDGHARWLLLQTILGTLDLEHRDPEYRDLEVGVDDASYRSRLHDYAVKALREADLHTSHRNPDEQYERRVAEWLDSLLDPGPALSVVRLFVQKIAVPAACNSLAAVLLKIAAPGVPDIYRGCEVWDGSLVDPDNRRGLDVPALRGTLASLQDADASQILARWHDGAIKMLVTRQALLARRRLAQVFTGTFCVVPEVTGRKARHVAALDRGGVVAIATRCPHALADGDWPLGQVWEDTRVAIGGSAAHTQAAHTQAKDLLTGQSVAISDGQVRLSDALAVLPVALLELS